MSKFTLIWFLSEDGFDYFGTVSSAEAAEIMGAIQSFACGDSLILT